MKPANDFREIVTGLWSWSSLYEEWNMQFSSCAWNGKDGLVLVDPIEMDDSCLTKLEKSGRPSAILLTNQNHERHADWFRCRYGIKVHVHRDAVPGIEITPDEFFCEGATVPGGLTVIHVPGVSPSESAFYSDLNGGMLLSGDVVVNGKNGLAFLPDDYCQDSHQNHESAKKFLKLEFEVLTVAHGKPVYPGARQQFSRLFGS